LMKLYALNDLRNQTPPRLDAFHTIDALTAYKNPGVTYWKKTYLYMDYCEAKNAYVCQRPATASKSTQLNGNQLSQKLN
jgi:hypothetical protein